MLMFLFRKISSI